MFLVIGTKSLLPPRMHTHRRPMPRAEKIWLRSQLARSASSWRYRHLSADAIGQIFNGPSDVADNPAHGAAFPSPARPREALLILSALMLVITGGEAMYADLGHFGARDKMSAYVLIAGSPFRGNRYMRLIKSIIPLVSSSFVRMFVGSRGMFVGKLAMFESSSGVLLCLFVLAEIVMMGRLMVVMRGGVVVSGGLVVMLTRRMLR